MFDGGFDFGEGVEGGVWGERGGGRGCRWWRGRGVVVDGGDVVGGASVAGTVVAGLVAGVDSSDPEAQAEMARPDMMTRATNRRTISRWYVTLDQWASAHLLRNGQAGPGCCSSMADTASSVADTASRCADAGSRCVRLWARLTAGVPVSPLRLLRVVPGVCLARLLERIVTTRGR